MDPNLCFVDPNLSLRFRKFKLALTGIQVCVIENSSFHQKNQVVVNRSELCRTRYFSSHFKAILQHPSLFDSLFKRFG